MYFACELEGGCKRNGRIHADWRTGVAVYEMEKTGEEEYLRGIFNVRFYMSVGHPEREGQEAVGLFQCVKLHGLHETIRKANISPLMLP